MGVQEGLGQVERRWLHKLLAQVSNYKVLDAWHHLPIKQDVQEVTSLWVVINKVLSMQFCVSHSLVPRPPSSSHIGQEVTIASII